MSDKHFGTKCFPEVNLQQFVEVDDALWTNEESDDKEFFNAVLNGNENKLDNHEVEEIVYKVSSFSQVYYSIDQVCTFVPLNSDINMSQVSIA